MTDREGPFVIGIDGGTGGIRAAVFDSRGQLLAMRAHEHRTAFPHPGWAEQDPEEWWERLVAAVRDAVAAAGIAADRVVALAVAGTASTAVCLDEAGRAQGQAILWMDNRASRQAQRMHATGHAALRRTAAGVSSEWMIPKLLWLKEQDPRRFAQARWFVEMADYLTLRLCGELSVSLNHVTHRWFYDPRQGGWPLDFYAAIGLDGIVERFPERVLPCGAPVGHLTAGAAEALGLGRGTLVVQGGTDAYLAMLGLKVTEPGEAALITGSSHLVLPVIDRDTAVHGIFGPHPDCVLPGRYVMEGGQVSSGSVVKWFCDRFTQAGDDLAHARLSAEAAAIAPGSEGLIVLDFWQGNRNPYTDYDLQGAIWGLTLKHTPAHVYRAILEGICFGTENILRTLAEQGLGFDALTLCGGATRNPFWLQLHADVSNLPIRLTEVGEATVLGAAVCAAAGGGLYGGLAEAAGNMVRITRTIEPRAAQHEAYGFYFDSYRRTHAAMKGLMHDMAAHLDAERRRKDDPRGKAADDRGQEQAAGRSPACRAISSSERTAAPAPPK